MKPKVTNLRATDRSTMTLEQVNERIADLIKKKGVYQKTLAHIERIKPDAAGPLWTNIKLKCNDMISQEERLQDTADEYDPKTQSHPIPDRILWKAAGLKKAAKTILAVQDLIDNEQGYRDSLANMEKELKDLAGRKQQLTAGK